MNEDKALLLMGDLADYNSRVSSFKKFENKTIMINGMLKIPNMRKEMVKKIVKKMPTYKLLYEKLEKLNN